MPKITKVKDLMFPVELRPVYTKIKINGITSQKKIPTPWRC